MSEPRRLLEGGSSFERALLGAAMEDRPSRAAQVAAAAALGIAAPLAGAGAASAASGSATSAAGASTAAGGAVVAGKAAAPFAVKWIALALITSGSAAGVAVLDRAAEPPIAPVIRERPRSIATPAPTAPESAPLITPLPDPAPAIEPAPAVTTPQPVKVRTVVRKQPRPAPVVEVAAPPLVDPPRLLAREIALVDRARAALAVQDAAGALAALEEHTRDFGNGALGPEALALAIDAHVMAGDRARARGVALVLADRYPDVALTKSYRALIEAEAPTEPAPSR